MSLAELSLDCPSKLNLFLHITGRRADGYHELQTLFQLLDHGDRMRFARREDTELRLSCDRAELAGENNLALRAARLLREHSGCRDGADIELNKRIPAGAGLGGGSANAAATLLALNRLWKTGLSRAELARLGLMLGADVPVFVHGRTAWAEGIGEKLEPVSLPGQRWYLVLVPDCHVATATVFRHRELTRNASAIRMSAFLAGCSRNDCQDLVRRLYPPVDAVFTWLERWARPRLTGTGAGVFAGFSGPEEAQAVLARLPEDSTGLLAGTTGFVAAGISQWQHAPDVLPQAGEDAGTG